MIYFQYYFKVYSDTKINWKQERKESKTMALEKLVFKGTLCNKLYKHSIYCFVCVHLSASDNVNIVYAHYQNVWVEKFYVRLQQQVLYIHNI